MTDADPGSLRIRIDLRKGAACADGRLDRHSAPALVEAVILITRAGHRVVDVDLQELDGIDSCGVKILLGLAHTLVAHGLQLTLHGAVGAVADELTTGQVLHLSGVASPRSAVPTPACEPERVP